MVYAEAHKRRQENQGLWQGYGQDQMISMILKYINFYLHKITTKIALWLRYTNSQLFLGEVKIVTVQCIISGAFVSDME